MADTPLKKSIVPTQIGKVGAPGKSCWVKFKGTPALADGGNHGSGDVTAFCVDGEDVYSFQDGYLHCNSTKFNIREPEAGVFLLRVHSKTAYFWCNNLDMYAFSLDPFEPHPGQVSWEGEAFPSDSRPVTFVPGSVGWLLTQGPDGTPCLSKWTKADGINTLTSITLDPKPGENPLGNISSIALIGQTLYVATSSGIFSVAETGTGYQASHLMTLPLDGDWGGIAGMLGQEASYNDAAIDGTPAFDRYLYVVAQNSGKIFLVFVNALDTSAARFSDIGATARYGENSYGNLQLDDYGLLYYVKYSEDEPANPPLHISTVNVLDNKFFYLGQNSAANNDVTLLPNRLMGFSASDRLTLEFYELGDQASPFASLTYQCTDVAPYPDCGFEYDKKFHRITDGEEILVPLRNPHGMIDGPALMLDLKLDGNIVIGDIHIDPHLHLGIHHVKPY